MKNIIRIVPHQSGDGTVQISNGTKFLLPDGAELGGVTRAEIVMEFDSVVRCKLELFAQAPEVFADIAQVTFRRAPIWQRILEWINGDQVREVTDLGTTECREFKLARNP